VICITFDVEWGKGSMTVREFRDRGGRTWRAWDINPVSIHSEIRAEDYLADCYQMGWIVFETPDGGEKRRLCPYPARWSEMSDPQLHELLARAEPVPASKHPSERRSSPGKHPSDASPAHGATHREGRVVPEEVDLTELRLVRSFRYPGGRLWSVYVVTHPEGGGPPVLRFAAGARKVDLRTWPPDWPDYTNEGLTELLRTAKRPTASATPGAPHRRYSDSLS
jgi:hypothetical protein